MKRHIVGMVLLLAGLAACDKPSEASCKLALANMQHLMGTENLHDTASLQGEIRRCKGGSKKAAVDCAIKATTLAELKHCDFYKVPDLPAGPLGTPAGSAAAPTAGSAQGSAAASAVGSASGAGSAGSAAGSAK